MSFWSRLKDYVVTGISVVSRAIYNGGQGFYSLIKVMDYFKATGHPAATAAIGVGVTGTVGSTFLVKTVPTYSQVSSSPQNEEQAPLGWGGWITDGALKTSGMIYGGMNAVSAYFLTTLISEGLNNLVSAEAETALWKDILIQIGAVIVAGATLYNYYTNDYRYIKQNTRIIGESVDERHFALNKSMAKTLATSSLNLVTYPMQAFFFAKPSIAGLPYLGKALGTTGTNILSGLASGTTLLTVVSWLPSVYKHFNQQPGADAQAVVIPANCKTISYKIASYTTGTLDSLGSNGLGPFISVIFTMNTLFQLNPYGWIIGLAALCGLNAFFMNLLFSTKEGTDSTLNLLYASDMPPASAQETRRLLDNTPDLETGTSSPDQSDSETSTRGNIQGFYSPQAQRAVAHLFPSSAAGDSVLPVSGPAHTSTPVPVAESARLRSSK
ncbi:hypothetical protein AQUSIP_16450 [Aquicella siphonis]|uniref:Uncharacterized protein n=1 Tax=Aquicella siphonis TaxID=254247 RepID=A0A5E4PHE5_9COXI|nr:hypothetical protein [Aquicella siphonis]VVC76334.1 hypothetical protein AQUSIP_16450 [Aquicella siphonis]